MMWLILCTAMDDSALWASQGLQARGLEPLECVIRFPLGSYT